MKIWQTRRKETGRQDDSGLKDRKNLDERGLEERKTPCWKIGKTEQKGAGRQEDRDWKT